MLLRRSRRLATAFAFLAMWRAVVPGAVGACEIEAPEHGEVTAAVRSAHHAPDGGHQPADERRPADDPSSNPSAGCPMVMSCAAVMFTPLVIDAGTPPGAGGAPQMRVVRLPASTSRVPELPPPRK